MAITLNDNILTDAPKPSDSRFGSYTTTVEANTATAGKRYQGLTVGILTGGSVVEYWYKDGIADGDLVEKSSGSGGGGGQAGSSVGNDLYLYYNY